MGYVTDDSFLDPLKNQIPVKALTHILYAFADVNPDTGAVFLTDSWADEQIHYEGDSWDEGGHNLYGNFKALYKLKRDNRHLKLSLSIGGWTYSPHFAPMADDAGKRAKFVSSSVDLVKDYGLDGLDIDWEYPKDASQAQAYVDLLKELRQALDHLHDQMDPQGSRFELTIAAPAGPDNYKVLKVKEMDQYLDFWNVMTYDLAGSWDSVAGHQANLYPASDKSLSVDGALKHYLEAGVHPCKVVMGIPLYGRGFEHTDGVGKPFQGGGQGTWEAGVYDYKKLPPTGAKEFFDPKLVAAGSYDSSKKTLISYDTLQSVQVKLDYINKKNLGGVMVWDLTSDFPIDQEKSILRKVGMDFEGKMNESSNHLHYPSSKWDNLRSGKV